MLREHCSHTHTHTPLLLALALVLALALAPEEKKTTVMKERGRIMGKLVKAAFLVAAIAHVFGSATFMHVYAQGTTSSSSFPATPSRYPESDQVSQALQQAAVCDCSCEAIGPDGTRTTPAELLKGNGAQMACSTCCESEELLQAMSELLPESQRTTQAGRACNEQQGLLAIFLAPTCWDVQAGNQCQFPFIEGTSQIVIDCTNTPSKNGPYGWCVYDMEAWNMRGEGWGYCAPKGPDAAATGPPSAANEPATSNEKEETLPSSSPSSESAATSSDNLDMITANLTASQEDFLSAGAEDDVVNQVKNSGGLTPAGIAVVTVICILVVGLLIGTVVVVYKLRNRIKMRRSSKFRQMDKTGAIGPAGAADKNITMTEL